MCVRERERSKERKKVETGGSGRSLEVGRLAF